MLLRVALCAKPSHIERLRVIVMVGLGFGRTTPFARLAQQSPVAHSIADLKACGPFLGIFPVMTARDDRSILWMGCGPFSRSQDRARLAYSGRIPLAVMTFLFTEFNNRFHRTTARTLLFGDWLRTGMANAKVLPAIVATPMDHALYLGFISPHVSHCP